MNPLRKFTLLLVFLLVGCSPTQTTQFPEAQMTPSESVSEPVQKTMPTVLLSPTAQVLPASTLAPTPSPVPALPTWTPLPTLPPKAGLQTFYEWMKGSDDCRLPCWAGVTPGKTIWAEAKQLVESMSGFAKLGIFRDENCTFGGCNEIRWSLNDPIIGVGYVYSRLPENKVHLIQIEIVDPSLLKSLELKNILNQYGKPAILLFSTDPDQPGQKFLELILVYPDRQFVIKYSKYAKLSGNKMVSCGEDSNIDLSILDNKEQLMSLNSIANAVETKNLYVDVWHKSVEEAAGMTIDKFYETFRTANAPCITTPTKIWVP